MSHDLARKIEDGEGADADFVEVTNETILAEYTIADANDGRVFQPIEWESGKDLLREPVDTFHRLPECTIDGFPLISSQRMLNPFQLFCFSFH